MDPWLPIFVAAAIIVGLLLWPSGRKKTMPEITKELNRQHYAEKKPRQIF